MLAPRWVQPRIGPLLRGGIDLSAYHRQILLAGLFTPHGYVRGVERWHVEYVAERRQESRALEHESTPEDGHRPILFLFRGDGNAFSDLYGDREWLLSILRRDTRARWRKVADAMAAPICINVRCGNDFKVAANKEDFFRDGALKTPLDWYVASLDVVRGIAGATVTSSSCFRWHARTARAAARASERAFCPPRLRGKRFARTCAITGIDWRGWQFFQRLGRLSVRRADDYASRAVAAVVQGQRRVPVRGRTESRGGDTESTYLGD